MDHIRPGKWIGSVVILYLIYVIVTGIFPYLRSKPVSQAFASSISLADFYGDAPCVDRVAVVESPTESFDTRISG